MRAAAAAAENATGIYRNWYRLIYYIMICVYNKYYPPIQYILETSIFFAWHTDRNVAFPASSRAHTHARVKYYIRFVYIYICVYMYTLRALLSYITSSIVAAGPFPWLRSRRSLFYGLLIVSYPQLKALSVHDVCAYIYTQIYVTNNWSRKCILYVPMYYKARPLLST